jgi:hypothetical protein
MAGRKAIARIVLPAAVVLWIAVVGAGMATLWGYATTSGAAGDVPSTWPAASRLERPTRRDSLLVFLHPRCPCSRATVYELARVMARTPGRFDAHAVFIRPAETDPGWAQTDLLGSARAIPGLEVAIDENGADAKLFGVATSGHVLLYGRSGNLLFSGGITAARGHAGDNAGAGSLIAIADGRPVDSSGRMPVFGCELFSADGSCSRGTSQCPS